MNAIEMLEKAVDAADLEYSKVYYGAECKGDYIVEATVYFTMTKALQECRRAVAVLNGEVEITNEEDILF